MKPEETTSYATPPGDVFTKGLSQVTQGILAEEGEPWERLSSTPT